MTQIKIILTTLVVVLLTMFSKGQTPTVGTSVQGDFDGDKKSEFAFVVKIKEGKGNPIEGGTPDEYSINFSTGTFKSIIMGCCDTRLINEGDLNSDGKDEISVYQAPMNGTFYAMTTYSFLNNSWKILIEPFGIPTGGEYIYK